MIPLGLSQSEQLDLGKGNSLHAGEMDGAKKQSKFGLSGPNSVFFFLISVQGWGGTLHEKMTHEIGEAGSDLAFG